MTRRPVSSQFSAWAKRSSGTLPGWGGWLLGVGEKVPVESYVPMMMFAIVFGLSMDYEVFLLSRVREAWLRTGDA